MSRSPRISIISPSFQQADYLAACLRSVQDQKGVEVEHIVVDGGSTDGSREILQRHADGLAWWCSEDDRGQSDAINKGLAHATGDVVNWLNSDDLLLPGALERVARAFADDPDLNVYGGRVIHRSAQGDHVFEKLNAVSDADGLFIDPVINQPATFYRTEVLREQGGVDPALRYVMDLALWWGMLFRHGVAGLRFDPVELALFRLHDASKTTTSMAGFLDETATLLHQLATDTGCRDWAALLAALHDPRPGLRRIPVREDHVAIVPRMVMHFVLKWHGTIHQRREFMALREALPLLEAHIPPRGTWERERVAALREQLRVGGWSLFRLRRKLKHLGR
ncbi:MAG: glycosyltransferase [Flavobacteriales bacterium]|nr:glycosyltransferase [Flavobacteriales bacterium]MCB9166332.1 glycosyltransferase [Flavobacteriales bacterium]